MTLKCESLKITLLVWQIWRLLATGDEDTALGHNNEFYIVYLKHDLFSLLIAILEQTMSYCLPVSLDLVLDRKDKAEKLMNTEPVISLDTIDFLKLEESMIDKVDGFERYANPVSDKVLKLFKHPRQLVSILKEVYHSASMNTAFMNSPGYSSLLELISLISCFVESSVVKQATVKQAEETELSVAINEDASNTSRLSKQERNQLERGMQLNAEKLGFNLNDGSIRDWLNVVFNHHIISVFMKDIIIARAEALLNTIPTYNSRSSNCITTKNNEKSQDSHNRNINVTHRVKDKPKTVAEIENSNSYVLPFNRLVFQPHEMSDSDGSNDSNGSGHEENIDRSDEDNDDSNGPATSSTGATVISPNPPTSDWNPVHSRLKSTGMKRGDDSSVGGSYQIFF
ncbi:unnamed protein product [Ambrosiozyma monospora]|uniref:Unnamed protein product n=1 Tax=Ambrosiozyma monospora TaxID=43982 RepID=A0ACB5T4F1_AMBMO|nr:unnamed protein product [Ambrosiozyma monospora]